jgi:hypothetical protein
MRVANGVPIGCSLFLPVGTVNCAQTRKDMLEVGRLHNFSESRTHFGAWAVMSSPLILSFDLRVDVRCAFSDRNLHSRMPLDPTPARLKLEHACDHCHSSWGVHYLLPVDTVNSVQTRKAGRATLLEQHLIINPATPLMTSHTTKGHHGRDVAHHQQP